ncbi:hypothetical protein FHS72_002921 [Loktanella ponticola]|uniref:Uncharacterized protein n=1 Tax=Yoonia ponticola TaxID=1524255 RepID=A0A7W9F0T3_9RHOB|nr:hypothetical protein [Yoonia ponticola]MBB5723281.1 hypothetical protein [Yoonia ponticola]
MLFRQTFILTVFAGLVGCATIPEIGGEQAIAARAAPYPDLIALETLVNTDLSEQPRITTASIIGTENRVNRLRANAAALRGPVVDGATRARMQGAISRAALR